VPEVELGEVDTHGDYVVAGLLQHVLQVHLQYRNTISIVQCPCIEGRVLINCFWAYGSDLEKLYLLHNIYSKINTVGTYIFTVIIVTDK
jgi:hypothetical protein